METLTTPAFAPLASDEVRVVTFAAERPNPALLQGFLRRYLGALAGTDPEALGFQTGEAGKPSLKPGRSDLRFSVSHSGSSVAVAVARKIEIGVDIERGRRLRRAEAIVRRYFSPKDKTLWNKAAAGEKEALFLRIWTRHEALAKAVGHGLFRKKKGDARLWWIRSLDLDGLFGAVAGEGPAPGVIVQYQNDEGVLDLVEKLERSHR